MSTCSPKLEASLKTPDVSAIFVDLDGTLISTDLLHEALIHAVADDFRNLFRIPRWAVAGPLTLKNELSQRVQPTHELPYVHELLQFLREERDRGVKIVLATASHRDWAIPVAAELRLFDGVLATNAETNLKGLAKLAAIQKWCDGKGCDQWAYVGDDTCDLPIWDAASVAYAVNRRPKVIRRLKQLKEPKCIFPSVRPNCHQLLISLRPHHWVKNALLFIPLLASHQFNNPDLLLLASLAFLAFSATASSIYQINDLLDLDADRRHPLKRQRPLASGALPVSRVPVLVTLLGTIALGAAWLLPWNFLAILMVYAAANVLYSFWLKTKPIIDVILLACLFTLRVIAGGTATGIVLSEWLLAFSMFIFTSLAFAKRHAELSRLRRESRKVAHGRGYQVGDLELLETLGVTSGYMAVLVMALYAQSPSSQSMYQSPKILWLMCPLILYWVSRLWLIARRGLLLEDPVVFAFRDRISLAILGIAIVILLAATKL